jgi:thymidylate synthase
MIEKLNSDYWTRQAVANLWDKRWDNVAGKRDYPCTVALGVTREPTFTEDVLNMFVTMRSNDIWLGLPYDMFQFTQLQHTICRAVDAQAGRYIHTAWSMHLYDRDLDASNTITEVLPSTHFDPVGIGELGLTNREIIHRARLIAREPEKIDWTPTESEKWYCEAIHG